MKQQQFNAGARFVAIERGLLPERVGSRYACELSPVRPVIVSEQREWIFQPLIHWKRERMDRRQKSGRLSLNNFNGANHTPQIAAEGAEFAQPRVSPMA